MTERTAAWTSSTDPAVAVGRVVGAHGLRGQLRVRCLAEAGDLLGLPRLILAARERDPEARGFEVERIAPGRPGELRVALAGVAGREEALALRGLLVWADPAHLSALAPGEYYAFQLVGCRVEACDGRPIGTVRSVWSTGAPELLVVVAEDGAEHLIPAAAELLREVDVAARRIVVAPLPGLLDAEAPRGS